MAIEIIPKKDDEKSPLLKNLRYAGTAFLILLIALSLIFSLFGYLFAQEVPEVENEIRRQKTKEILDLEKRIEGYYKKTKNLPLIIRNRESAVSFLEVTEKLTHPSVFFPEFEIISSEKKANASGIARNIVAFDQQFRIFEENESIIDFHVQEFEVQEDRTVEFSIEIFFK